MPQIVTCPDCGRKLRVPDNLLGKNVKCPGCGQKFLAGAGAPPEEEAGGAFAFQRESAAPPKSPRRRDEPLDEDYPVSSRRDEDDDRGGPVATRSDVRTGWERVRLGVNLIIMGVWVLLGAVAVLVSGFLMLALFGFASFSSIFGGLGSSGPVTQAQANQAAGQVAGTGCAMMIGMVVVYGLAILLVLAYVGLTLTGKGFFMGVASTRKTQHLRVLGIITFCAAVANLLLPSGLLGVRVALAGSVPYQAEACLGFAQQGLWVVLGLTEFICFFLFLRGVAAVMRKDGLATNVVIYMVSVPVYGLLWLVSGVLLFLLGMTAMVGAFASSSNSNASTAAGNVAGAGAAVFVGGLACMAFMVLIGLGLFIWYVVLLHQVRGAIDGWLNRN